MHLLYRLGRLAVPAHTAMRQFLRMSMFSTLLAPPSQTPNTKLGSTMIAQNELSYVGSTTE
jgi:hypothetical protein